MVRGRCAELRRARPARQQRDHRPLADPRPRRAHGRRPASPGGRVPGRAATARCRFRRPRRRLPAEHPRDDRRLPCHGQPRGDLVVGRPRVRAAGRDRPVRSDRAQGAFRGRRLHVRRRADRPLGRSRRHRRRPADGRTRRHRAVPLSGGSCKPGGQLGRAARRARSARVRPGAGRPPAVGAVQLGHDRAAEGDRAQPRRDPRRAPEDDDVPSRPRSRRSVPVVHHHRVDDVERARLGPADRRHDRHIRR